MPAEDLRKLRQHHNATIGLFVAFWIFTPVAIVVIELFDISQRAQNALIGTIFGAAIVISLLQFSKRCPHCRANLGWQSRLGIPRHCGKCGSILREDQ
ncbi:MAG: hypothetical protein OEN02_03605 [Gammaproteobacteria bacterium]|nr:hypothetical protein [Gammaproteobacteria bacterium]MDH3534583.1 hypothetical protein [Gammaproteobacteria bacterium]